MGLVAVAISIGAVLIPGVGPAPRHELSSFDLETAESDSTVDNETAGATRSASDAAGAGQRLELPPSISAADRLSVSANDGAGLAGLVGTGSGHVDESLTDLINRLRAEPATTTTTGGLVEPTVEPEAEWVDAGHGVAVPDVLLRIRFCESTNYYQAAHRVSSARGAYQFLTKSWNWYGHAARYGVASADQATPAQQDEAAVLTLRRSGTRPWAASRHCWASASINPNYATFRPATTTTAVTTTTSTTAPGSDSSATTSATTSVPVTATTTTAPQTTPSSAPSSTVSTTQTTAAPTTASTTTTSATTTGSSTTG
jgi:hypothetical protein